MIAMIHSFVIFFAEACQPGVGGNILGIPTWYKYLGGEIENGRCSVLFAFPNDIGAILLAVVEIVLRIGAYVAIAMIIWGGIQYQLSQGEPDKTKNARTTIINAIIGLVIAILATAIVNIVGRNTL
jgi:hypothetical protein